jgi:NAD(P)-dependent dehydrogenase (short-subunit alcohol dehydrogenase family)
MNSSETRVAVVTGGGGVLCSAMCLALAERGFSVAVLDLKLEAAQSVVADIRSQGDRAIAIACDVLSKESLQSALETVEQAYGRVDTLINGAGGNKPLATTNPERPFFDLPLEATKNVFDLNFMGTFIACQVFGNYFASKGEGNIINIASMNAIRPLTRIPAYSAAKAAVANFTQWLAVHMAQEYTPRIRVNAIAPGFFLTNQNRYLLVDEQTGNWTPRGQQILSHTPQGRFGTPEDLLSTLFWLLSPDSSFITGIVVPVDGGFAAFSGV